MKWSGKDGIIQGYVARLRLRNGLAKTPVISNSIETSSADSAAQAFHQTAANTRVEGLDSSSTGSVDTAPFETGCKTWPTILTPLALVVTGRS